MSRASSPAESVTVGPNGTFTLTLGVTTNFVSSAYTVFYQSNNGQGLFQINSCIYLNPVFLFVADPVVPQLLNPSTMSDFGASGDQVTIRLPGPSICGALISAR